MNGDSQSQTPSQSQSTVSARRFLRPKLRQATLILPKTGERVRRTFTLRSPDPESADHANDTTPLLGGSATGRARHQGPVARTLGKVRNGSRKAYSFATSPLGVNLLKCSIAYVLGSLATFVPVLSNFLGRNDGKHMVATITVYFHPARSAGSMMEAFMLATMAFLYATAISFSSMGVSMAFAEAHLLVLGHAIVLILFCGGGLGFIGWIKQRLGNPLVNVACSLASLALITVLTKEGAVQAATFSYNKIVQVLKMVFMGITATTAVSLIIRPVSARNNLRNDMRKATDVLSDMLTTITHSFLLGAEDELKQPDYIQASSKFKSTFSSMTKNLGEAKMEHYALGTENEYHIETRLVKCMERVAQNIGGLRGAALTQFSLISKPSGDGISPGITRNSSIEALSRVNSGDFTSYFNRKPSHSNLSSVSASGLAAIEEAGEEASDEGSRALSPMTTPGAISAIATAETPADIFTMFISYLGPSVKSLAFTLKEVLDELPYGPSPDYIIAVNSNFRSSLVEARDLFVKARKEALDAVYANRGLSKSKPIEVLADYEEVAASCGYFSSALQDCAEEMIVYLDVLEELKQEVERSPRKRTWNWLRFWHKRKNSGSDESRPETPDIKDQDHARGISQNVQIPRRPSHPAQAAKMPRRKARLLYRIYRSSAFLRREDIKYAIKVAFGAILYAMWSFIPETRPTYSHWRGEWGLLSYMLVCSMTIGASNTTGYQRFSGTCLGAVFAIVAWLAAQENPFVLGFFGWVVSLICFYIIVGKGKGPMGRFILLTYNLSALYAYSLSVKDDEDDDDEGGVSPEIFEIAKHRVVAVMVGCLWGIVITRLVWPISARQKIKDGVCVLWLRMALIWKRDPLSMLLDGVAASSIADIRESIKLQRFLNHLEALRKAAASEFEMSGPFPSKVYGSLFQTTGRILDAFHAMNVVISKDLKASAGEQALLKYTRDERIQLSSRISHLFSVMASSMKLEYPLNDALPNIEHTRDRLLARIFDFRKNGDPDDIATDDDYELLYAYALVTGQIAEDIASLGQDIEQLYGVLNEDNLKLQ
ncbi:putative 60s ribosomal protein l19 [Diplodia seriata]|uniref:Putative 60s ribosomal protein l19 n=1 Tax=Diplodia seriata TaxID=420778 RepID=A0A0G2GTE1_9PEZI|nr:putative 60s ribosomal protein l19 [Diplodia seriata]